MKILSFILLVFVASISQANTDDSKEKVSIIDISSLDFDADGIIMNDDFARAFCTETRNGVTFSASVGCFLCSPQRASARCASVLSDRIDSVSPEVIY